MTLTRRGRGLVRFGYTVCAAVALGMILGRLHPYTIATYLLRVGCLVIGVFAIVAVADWAGGRIQDRALRRYQAKHGLDVVEQQYGRGHVRIKGRI